jgi:hypothetical protein
MKVGFCLLGCLFLLGCAKTVEVSQLSAEDVLQIEIFPSRWDAPGPPPDSTTVKEPEQIQALLTVLQPIGDANRAGLIDQAKMIVMEKTGKKILLQLQPGNDADYYEYLGQGKAFRIFRKPFLEVMERVGVKWLPK